MRRKGSEQKEKSRRAKGSGVVLEVFRISEIFLKMSLPQCRISQVMRTRKDRICGFPPGALGEP